MNLQENIRRILREEKDRTKLIKKIIDYSNIFEYEHFCGVDIINPEERTDQYNFLDKNNVPFLIKVYFIGGPNSKVWPRTQGVQNKELDLMDGLHSHIISFFPINIEMMASHINTCDGYDKLMKRKYSTDELQETIRRILREELSPRVRRRIDPDEMEKEFLESFESAYNLTKRRKVLSTHFLDELIYTTISMMMDGFHWRFTSTLPEDEFWYDEIHTGLENHYKDRITQMYNEREGINESILRKETEIPAFLRRRFSSEDLDWLVNDVKELIDYGESLDTAIYDGIREFVKSRKFEDIDEFGVEADYWESYLRYERPLVDYVKKKLRITDNVNESILREEAQIPLPIKRRVTNSDIEESFLISLDRIDDERRYSKMSVMKNISLQTFAKMVIDDMVTNLEYGYFNDENRIYFNNDETYHDEIRVPLMNYFADKIKKRYSGLID